MIGWRTKSALLFGSLLLCLAAGEVAVRLLEGQREIEYEVDPELYWVLRPNQDGFLRLGPLGRPSPPVRINTLGLRGADVAPPDAERVRILALGDSYTFGWGVAEDETFAAALERAATPARVEVVNGGGPGYGLFQTLERARRLLPVLRPAVVLLTLPPADIMRQPFPDAAATERYLRTYRWQKRLRAWSRLGTLTYRQLVHLRARLTAQHDSLPTVRQDDGEAAFAANWQRDQERLRELAALCARHGAALAVMAWPDKANGARDAALTAGLDRLAGEGLLVALPDLRDALRPLPPAAWLLPDDPHPSAAAHALAGRYLATALAPLIAARATTPAGSVS